MVIAFKEGERERERERENQESGANFIVKNFLFLYATADIITMIK
jgi:hypothetical protein